jgi:predicted transcriptional regulator
VSKTTNITLKLDAELVRKTKVLAAQKGTSVSALIAQKLGEAVEEDAYQQAMKRAFALMEKGWAMGWQKPKSRDELHER